MVEKNFAPINRLLGLAFTCSLDVAPHHINDLEPAPLLNPVMRKIRPEGLGKTPLSPGHMAPPMAMSAVPTLAAPLP